MIQVFDSQMRGGRRFGKVGLIERSLSPHLYISAWSHGCMLYPLVSTRALPRAARVGTQTFSIAIFAACLALTQKVEIVIFSPARRASRKLLERIIE